MFKKRVSEDLIDFSMQNISTGKIASYIINVLYRQFKFYHIGWRCENRNGQVRCVLYTLYPANQNAKQYFKDRCSAMVEQDVKACDQTSCEWTTWTNGFKELVEN